MQRNVAANIKAMMKLIDPVLKGKGADGTKKQKVSYMVY